MRGGEQRRAGRRGCTNWGEGGISLLGSPHQTPGQRGGPQPTAGHAGPWDGGRDLTPWQAAPDPRTEGGPQPTAGCAGPQDRAGTSGRASQATAGGPGNQGARPRGPLRLDLNTLLSPEASVSNPYRPVSAPELPADYSLRPLVTAAVLISAGLHSAQHGARPGALDGLPPPWFPQSPGQGEEPGQLVKPRTGAEDGAAGGGSPLQGSGMVGPRAP